MKTLADLLDDYEAERLATERAKIAAEDAAYAALSPDEKQRLSDERAARWEALVAASETADEDDSDDENDED